MERPTNSKRKLKPRKLPSECLCCGAVNPWVINKVELVAPFRETEHCISAEAHQCRHCDAITTTPEQVEAISTKVQDAHKAWLSCEFKKAQQELGLSIRGLAAQISVPQATLARISSGKQLVEASVEKLLWQEIGDLRQSHLASEWIHMSIPVSTETVTIKIEPHRHVYSKILETASQSPLVAETKSLWENSGQALRYA